MFIAIKDTKVIAIHELEWQCRRKAKGLSKPEYWTWLESVTTEDENGIESYDFSGEDYEVVETEVDVQGYQQSGYITTSIERITSYHLSWDGTTVSVDDTAKAAYDLAEEWKRIRAERTRLLAETDYLALKDNTLSTTMKEYRDKLRSVPQDNSDPYNITWPTKPS